MIAAAGESIRTLVQIFTLKPRCLMELPFKLLPPIVLAARNAFESYDQAQIEMIDWANSLKEYLGKKVNSIPLILMMMLILFQKHQ